MTPGARVAAAIEILEDIRAGQAAEQALTRWARRSRFAGSKDRAAIRDHVFDVLRCRPLAAHYGRGETGRALMLGLLHLQDGQIDALFSGEGHAPAPPEGTELDFPAPPDDRATRWCLPEWLVPLFATALGDGAGDTARALQSRAPVSLRVNLARIDRGAAQALLAEQGVETALNPATDAALTVTKGERRIRNAPAYADGLVELQDAASQAVVAALPGGGRVLDYCAGGGGKALALAMDPARVVLAHDIDPRRMSDLPARAARAGASIRQVGTEDLAQAGPYDVVLCDAPCSGSGAWRRAAEGKWTLTPDRLADLTAIQDGILDAACGLVAPGGTLAFATCSVLREENEDRSAAFLARHPEWACGFERRFPVDAAGDGFYTAHFKRV
ncbi:Ribosomal RNA small subunit methyltransferase B [Sulfitobacter sp. THAF37]|uniref:RsmB/NOP family class I SAM-dependent RNA methyltransferase n=1 Tax=Sulfitobacter sp. THAF37 TaxID=2587855 RepID=UPI00126837C7|nr:RsmB/NOP family class I SAM-dependent RNA methyltransferase [Sulfitobacter sp. THAF37]QFT59907.1 Ribosomal RNA small subunit methyltransferase B [Sulfitobacter sp. THAF37]